MILGKLSSRSKSFDVGQGKPMCILFESLMWWLDENHVPSLLLDHDWLWLLTAFGKFNLQLMNVGISGKIDQLHRKKLFEVELKVET